MWMLSPLSLGHRRKNIWHASQFTQGEHLAEELDALKMTAAEPAGRLNVPTNRVTEILNGQRAITGDTALRLAHFFGTRRVLAQPSESV
jgi:addiction module HigA family antidote